jgi:hypothetical protein
MAGEEWSTGGGVEMGTQAGERVHGLERLMALELSGTRDWDSPGAPELTDRTKIDVLEIIRDRIYRMPPPCIIWHLSIWHQSPRCGRRP